MAPSRPALLAAALLLPALAGAQGAAAPAAAASTPTAAMRAEIVAQLDDAGRKFVALAEATPQDKYAWRPAAGVRSTSEVFMHMVGANYMIPGMAGAPKAQGVDLPRDAERSITDKARVVQLLRSSFDHARASVAAVPDDQLAASVNLFGRQSTKLGVLVLMATHAHEHLGQSIAYARSTGIVPPWSRGSAGGN